MAYFSPTIAREAGEQVGSGRFSLRCVCDVHGAHRPSGERRIVFAQYRLGQGDAGPLHRRPAGRDPRQQDAALWRHRVRRGSGQDHRLYGSEWALISARRAARASRSLMASPRSSFGIGMTAMARRPGGIERAQMREQIRGGLDQIARRRQIEGALRAGGAAGPKASSASPGRTPTRIEPQRRPRRIVRGEHAGRERRVVGCAGSGAPRARGRARARSPRAAGRRAAAASALPRHDTIVELHADAGGSAVDDQVDAAVEIGAHMLRESSARHGRTDSPTARPSACRTPSTGRARSGGPARAPRSSRDRRSRAPTPGNHPASAAPA